MNTERDVIVIGGGPAGQKAAIQAAKAGRSVLVVEREGNVGGACVHHGTIPSKTLRETALAISSLRRKTGAVLRATVGDDTHLASLMTRAAQVITAHDRFIGDQLDRNRIERLHGRAKLASPEHVEVTFVSGERTRFHAPVIVIATGSRPRAPKGIPIDHEHVLDSDSILSLRYLPSSLCVLGGGVIASEYASIFAALGVRVCMIDKGPRPLGFVDPELVSCFVKSFEAAGGQVVSGRGIVSVRFDGISECVVSLDDGTVRTAEKVLCALGRVANVDGLDLAAAGLQVNARGFLDVDEHCQTRVPGIYAVGDVIGPPSLASASMEQGRRAVRHALSLDPGAGPETVPAGIYTIPEIASVGLDEEAARHKLGGAPIVGRARFSEIARAHIASTEDGMLKLVCDAEGRKVLGVQVVGEGASELVHLGQMAILASRDVDVFVDAIFNFPTLAEAYRVAALDVIARRAGPA
jgi:NAD(P) transhydrogenase